MAVTDRLCDLGALDRASLGLADPEPFRALDVDVAALEGGPRPLTRSCLDWSERRPHLAGRLGAAVVHSLLDSGWVERRPRDRALVVTGAGRTALQRALGLDVGAEV